MAREQTAIMDRYIIRVLVLNIFFTTLMVATLVAGPASKKTRAAPGLSPFKINAAAIGVEDVAHTYMGIPAHNIINMDKN